MAAIDINADLGESFGVWTLGDDAGMLDVITSANIACGFHAGDPSTLRVTCQAAADRNVAIGAQVAYPDLAGFGRRFIDIDPAELRDAVLYQLGALNAFAQIAGTGVKYLKPHGALYHACIDNERQAEAVATAAAEFDPSLAVVGAPGSRLLEMVHANRMEAVPEGFADRAYTATGRLVPRREASSVLQDLDLIRRQVVALATANPIITRDGTELILQPRSICIHGDTPGAVAIARAVREALEQAAIGIHAFTD